jgi:hypothetical protein
LRGLDVGALDAVEVCSLDADQFDGRLAPRRMHVADVIEMRIAGLHDVGAQRLDQRRLAALAGRDDLPIRHLGRAFGLPVDRPARAMVVGRANGGSVINMAADAEAELRILVEDLARVCLGGARLQIGRQEHRIARRARHIIANLEPAGAARIGPERGVNIGGELLKRVGHRSALTYVSCFLKIDYRKRLWSSSPPSRSRPRKQGRPQSPPAGSIAKPRPRQIEHGVVIGIGRLRQRRW